MAQLLVNAGRALLTAFLAGASGPKYIGWGTGGGTTAVGDTTLFIEASEARVAGTQTQQTTSVTNDTYQLVGTMTANGAKTVTNAGCFDAAAAGNMFIKADFTGIPLGLGDQIQFTFKWQVL